ncbi:MAG: hypothetical protein DMD63_14550 [Gemmatimonadetes bacterium]|nr:MAG: hypothetical protein DMD63_14550 [Gemmatimonadota bacterium]
MSKMDSLFNPDQYATVAERIELFYSRFPLGRINTELVGREDGEITFKALVYRSADDTFAAATGWASEREGDSDINTVACLENTETSAVGRALANLGFTASSKRPSREEIEKAVRIRNSLSFKRREQHAQLHSQSNVTDDLLELLSNAEQKGFPLRRAEILCERVKQPGLSAARVRKIESSLRAWLRRHEM